MNAVGRVCDLAQYNGNNVAYLGLHETRHQPHDMCRGCSSHVLHLSRYIDSVNSPSKMQVLPSMPKKDLAQRADICMPRCAGVYLALC
jgi:hypothetical protein